jgi:Transposase DDE domain
MYVDTSTVQQKGKTYTRHLLRESYRENGKVQHRTIANLSRCSEQEVEAIKVALRYKENLQGLVSLEESLQLRQGPSVGAVWLLYGLAKELKIEAVLGTGRQGKLALWQVMARIIDQGSRLSAVRLASYHAVCDIVGLESFVEDDLYENLDWLSEKQGRIEEDLFRRSYGENPPVLYLYDVTSSYLEGMSNVLGAFGYNRDGKRGKKQIVLGLLCDPLGRPLSIEVFPGDTQDLATFGSQVQKVAGRFGRAEVVFVGDRGMIKGPQMKELASHRFHYISALTKPQIESLLAGGVLQMSLFDQQLTEVISQDGNRYVLRCNPVRAQEIARSRQDKLASLEKALDQYNLYLQEHRRAKVEVGRRILQQKAQKLRISEWICLEVNGRVFSVRVDPETLAEVSKLDGCYALKTDLPTALVDKETIHDRYKDLTLVEKAFRTCKTVQLEMRPIHVRLEERTRGHAFVVMLAYRITQELAKRWSHLNLTVQEGIDQLTTLCSQEVIINGKPHCHKIPQPDQSLKRLFEAAAVRLPAALPNKGVRVTTKQKLQKRRITG